MAPKAKLKVTQQAREDERDGVALRPQGGARNKRELRSGAVLEEFTLYHPAGFPVTVLGESRAQTLRERGYTDAPGGKPSGSTSTAPAEFDTAAFSVEEVLEHVGDDPERAAEALGSERARGDRARTTLLRALEEIAEGEEE